MSGERRPITDGDVRQVEHYGRQGLTQAEICRATGIGRVTVRRILRGEYVTDAAALRSKSQRCVCGGLIYQTPCVACTARQHQAAGRAAQQRGET